VSRSTPANKKLGRPRDVDSTETRLNLLEVSRRIFARDGYGATTNRSIAEEAGITTGAIYHYFPSKAELYAAVYEVVQHIVYDRFDQALEEGGSLTQRFSSALDAAVELNRSDSSIAGFLVTVPSETLRHPELAELLVPIRERTATFVGRLVADAAAAGEFVDGVKPRAVEDLLNAVLSGLATFSTITGDVARHAEAIHALQQFLDGVLVKPLRP
jgi:AcrR family transcriptional regulator